MAKRKKKQQKRKNRWKWKLVKWAFLSLVAFVLVLSVFVGLVYLGVFGSLPSKADLKNIRQEEASRVYTDDGALIGKFFAENRTNVSFESLPTHLVDALLATEDIRFYEHEGVDNWAIARVAVKTILMGDRGSGGGSTITQQLAKNLFGRSDWGWMTIVVNKSKEMILANRLENVYGKDEIIELYLNTVPYGENIYGIESAAYRYFNKSVADLSVAESAVLVGMLKANTYYNPHLNPDNALRRRNIVLGQMAKYDLLNDKKAEALKKQGLGTEYTNLNINNPNGYFLDRVKQRVEEIITGMEKPNGGSYDLKVDGLEIRTTLNNQLQQQALAARKDHLQKLQQIFNKQWRVLKQQDPTLQSLIDRKVRSSPAYQELEQQGLDEAAIMDSLQVPRKMLLFNWEESKSANLSVVDSIQYYLKMVQSSVFAMDPNNGAVKCYVGGNSHSYLPYDLVQSKRQAASTFKPFIYTAAIDQGMDPCEWIDNEPKVYAEYSNWTPQNYDDTKGGYYSVRGALAKSMNIPTVAIYLATDHDAIASTVKDFGFSMELPASPSVALGSESVSLYEMVRAYSVFANGGQRVEPVMIQSIRNASGEVIYQHEAIDTTTILNNKTATIMQQMLKGVVDSGTAASLRHRFGVEGEWGGKTGTSQNYGDAWFVGFNPNLVAGVWVGTRYPAIHFTSGIGAGSQAALPIFGNMISQYQQSHKDSDLIASFPQPSPEMRELLNCPFYRDERGLEKVEDFFQRVKRKLFNRKNKSGRNEEQEKEQEEEEDKPGLFKRIFGGGKD